MIFLKNNKVGETKENLTMWGLPGQVRGFGFYAKCDGKPVECLEQGPDMM